MAEAITERRERVRARSLQRKAEKREQRNEKHLASIADSLKTIAETVASEEGWLVWAILQHATVIRQDVAKALNTVAHKSRSKK